MTCKAVVSVVGFRGVPGSVEGQGADGKSAYEVAGEGVLHGNPGCITLAYEEIQASQ